MSPASSPGLLSIITLTCISAHALIACGPASDADDVADVDAGGVDATPDAAPPRLTTLGPGEGETPFGFGYAMAASGDTLVVGATQTPVRVGAAYVFVRRAGGWERQAKLVGDPGAVAFGEHVAIGGDTIAVSERLAGATTNDADVIRVRVFTRRGASWSEAAVLSAAAPNGGFGAALAVERDTIFVGDGGRYVNNQHVDAGVRVFERDGAAWTERAVLVPTGATPSWAYASALALDGDRLVVGDHSAKSPAGDVTGQAYVFERAAGTWQHAATLAPRFVNVWPHDVDFGGDVALRGDRIVISTDDFCPQALVFERSGGAWSEVASLDPNHNVCGRSSPRVAIGDDVIVIAATGIVGEDGWSDIPGAGYLFRRTAGAWSMMPERVAAEDATSTGSSVVLTDDELLLGAPRWGRVYVHAR